MGVGNYNRSKKSSSGDLAVQHNSGARLGHIGRHKKRKADGKGKMEIIRCLKRFVARKIFGYLCGAQRLLTSLPKTT
jgi:hypothetical protein